MAVARLSPRARRELTEAIRRIAKDNPLAAEALHQTVIKAAALITDNPRIGFVREAWAGTSRRFFVVSGFPYLLVYNAERHPPLILRVVHGAHDLPAALRDR
ncbi:type II toxin-antitoxin system RelE/ParE family toxin [Oleomonas cavernae]|uniref:Type II toxin-antitoxin system RelE/ParE family toxin n=1 Tax=Oleomonas cavernae TaxID=2320859 RepID=A0A418VTJ6_9PROT|nr:type II toxin-antitoxin system RelE/ParE family toxin [Oleomonas cavernae]RJF80463.1 type II toxin-antitoxin system RelE/ParE family toxin [Oleomonas cavernae]